MRFSYQWLNEYLTYTVSPQDIAELLTMHAFEVEGVEQSGEEDWVLDIAVLPNRASDALSHQGMAREINAIAGLTGKFFKKEASALGDPDEAKTWLSELGSSFSIAVQNKEDCPLYYALRIKGVNVGKSPEWLTKRLRECGIESVTNVVDVSNYVMLDTGQPTHMFDAARIDAKTLAVRKARKDEPLALLDGTAARLDSEDLVITSQDHPVALAGIKGGKDSAISEHTKEVVIEAANFNPRALYKTASRLHIATESAKRFSAGVPFATTRIGLMKAARLLQEIAGGTIEEVGLYEALPGEGKAPLFLQKDRVQRLVGMEMSGENIRSPLFHLGFEVKEESAGVWKVTPPYWRLDCHIAEDLVEEIVRLNGLETIPLVAPFVALGEPVYSDTLQWRTFTRKYFTAQGFDEMYNYSLVSKPEREEGRLGVVALQNPLSAERAYLRDNLIDGLLKNVKENQGLFGALKLFEIGRVFWEEDGTLHEEEHVAGVLYDRKRVDFRDMRGYVEEFLQACGFDPDDYVLEPPLHAPDKMLLTILIEGKECGTIHVPIVPPHLHIKGSVVAFEMRDQELYRALTDEREFAPVPKYPAIIRDISLVVAKNVRGDSIIQAIHELGKDLIEDVDVFDMYEEESSDAKSLAFHVIYRAGDRTLTDEEVGGIHTSIEQALTTRFHAQIK